MFRHWNIIAKITINEFVWYLTGIEAKTGRLLYKTNNYENRYWKVSVASVANSTILKHFLFNQRHLDLTGTIPNDSLDDLSLLRISRQ